MATSALRLLLKAIFVLSISFLCVYGNCQQPFSGPNCKRRNIAYNLRNLPAEQNVLGYSSYTSTNFYPLLAFDGDLSSAYITNVEQNPYLWVNLKSNYTLHTMTLYIHANRPSDLNGFKIEVAYSSDFRSPSLCYQDQSSQGQPVHLINCTQPIEGQYVRIQIPTAPNNNRSLSVYEFEIYQCVDGYYGWSNCKACGQCRAGDKCDKISGDCPNGCDAAGKKPKLCQSDCDDFTYGQGCTGRCGKCANNVPCNKQDGACTNCVPGYTGQLCNACTDGYYSWPNCKACGQCRAGDKCDKISGDCPNGCDAAGKKPKLCQADCDAGTYGQGCAGQCGKCANNVPCNKLNGACANCAPGYSGQLCNECADGYYGFPNCQACGLCRDDDHCNKINGECPNGCVLERTGKLCQAECADGYYGFPNCNRCGLCRDGDHCNKINGECPNGCVLGRTGKLCQAECQDGTYGTGCALQCANCANNVPCDKVDGTCPTGCKPRFTGQLCDECAEGYSGMNCEISSSESPDCCLCDTVDGARSVVRDDAIDKIGKSPTGYIVGLCIAIVLCIITTALMVVFYFQKQRYLKLYIASDATRYASFQKNPAVDASEVVYEQPPL